MAGQTGGSLSGKVTAADGKPVPNAPITATNSDTGVSQRGLTSTDGTFTISNLPVGTYVIEVDVPGYKHLSQTGVLLSPTSNPVTLTLVPGSSQETVVVNAMTGLVQNETAEISRSYDSRYVRSVPFIDRNIQHAVSFMPGVTLPVLDPFVQLDPQGSYFWQTNGQRFEANRQNLDGIQNDEPVTGVQVHSPTAESIQQYNVETSNYDVIQGRAAGAITNVVGRSGTNGWHGSGFEFNRNSGAAARDFFNPKRATQQANFNNNLFGAAVGGAVRPDHTFLFGSWEYDLFRGRNPILSTVPTASFRAGDFSAVPGLTLFDPITGVSTGAGRTQFTNNIIPTTRFNPVSQNVLNLLPLPNSGGLEYNFFSAPAFRNDRQRWEGRVDNRFNDKFAINARYGYTNAFIQENSPYGSLLGSAGTGDMISNAAILGFAATGAVLNTSGQGQLRSDAALIGVSYIFSPSLVMDLRVGYNRFDNRSYTSTSGAVSAASLGFTTPSGAPLPFTPVPTTIIPDMLQIGDNPNFPQTNIDSTLNIVNAWSKRFGRHDLRFGVDFYGIRADGFQNLWFGPQGAFAFGPGTTLVPGLVPQTSVGLYPNSFASFLLGTPTVAGAARALATPSVYEYQFAGYIADRVQLFPKLTLDLGLRYEYFGPVRVRSRAGVNTYTATTNQLVPLTDNAANVDSSTLNFSPRIGFAFSPTDRAVIRGGYAIAFFPGLFAAPLNTFVYGVTGAQLGNLGEYTFPTTYNVIPSVPLFTPGSTVGAPNYPYMTLAHKQRTPYTQMYNVSVQYDAGLGILAGVGYVGNTTRFLPFTQEINAALPGTGIAGLPLEPFGRSARTLLYERGLNSNYNSLQLQATKRFAAGFAFTAAYTYSRSLDDSSTLFPITLNGASQKAYHGPSNFDQPHLFTLSHLWQLPFGPGGRWLNSGLISKLVGPWELNGILHGNSGLPFTPISDPTGCNCPNNTALRAETGFLTTPSGPSIANTNGAFLLPVVVTGGSRILSPAAQNTLGSAGRNILRGDSFWNYDLALFRSFVFLEHTKLEFRAEAYNIANNTHFAAPILSVNSPFFGQSTSTLPGYSNRTLQFALRVVF
jgi:hypothetical protein